MVWLMLIAVTVASAGYLDIAVRDLVMAVGDAVGNKLQAHEQNMAEHVEVMDHLLAQQGEDAASAMGRHIDGGAQRAAQYLGNMLANRPAPQPAS